MLIGICAMNFVLFIAAKVYYVQINKRRDRIWNAMSKEEKQTYMNTTKDKGNKRYVLFFLNRLKELTDEILDWISALRIRVLTPMVSMVVVFASS